MRFIPDEKYNIELRSAIEKDEIDLANQIHEIGNEQNVVFDDELLKILEGKNSSWSAFTRNGRDAWKGASSGNVTSSAGLAGAIASDISGVSDFRDLANELHAYPDYDSFTVGLSLVGITATVLTVFSLTNGGVSAIPGISTRIGTTSLKVIRTSGKLSKKLEKVFTNHSEKIINKQAIENLSLKINAFDFADTQKLNELSTLAKNTINVKAIRPLNSALNDIRIIRGNSGFVGLSRGLSVADDLADLSRLKKLSAVTKTKFAGALTLAPKLAKPIYKVLRVLLEAITFLLGAAIWLLSALRYVFKIVRSTILSIFKWFKYRAN
jgi:hypothetical protein